MSMNSEQKQQRAEVQQKQDAAAELKAKHDAMVEEEARLREEVRDENIELGIDPDFPSFIFPIYPGMEILETTKEDAMSSLGEEMDKWYIKGQVDAALDEIHDYYRDRMAEEGMNQTQYISIPSGYAFNYANEWYEARFTIEKQATFPMPQVEITVFRVRDDSFKVSQ